MKDVNSMEEVRSLIIKIPEGLHKKLRQIALDKDMTLKEIILPLLQEFVVYENNQLE